jgi:hypothetical protein
MRVRQFGASCSCAARGKTRLTTFLRAAERRFCTVLKTGRSTCDELQRREVICGQRVTNTRALHRRHPAAVVVCCKTLSAGWCEVSVSSQRVCTGRSCDSLGLSDVPPAVRFDPLQAQPQRPWQTANAEFVKAEEVGAGGKQAEGPMRQLVNSFSFRQFQRPLVLRHWRQIGIVCAYPLLCTLPGALSRSEIGPRSGNSGGRLRREIRGIPPIGGHPIYGPYPKELCRIARQNC